MIEPVEDVEALNAIWKQILPEYIQKWVLFKYGTIVLCQEENKDPEEHALDVMREHGPVVAGTPLGDFNVKLAGPVPGWVVLYSHPDIGSYLSPDEFEDANPPAFEIGMTGRQKRHEDFLSLKIVHVER
ncbi:MAG: hypothetical protein ACFFF4_00240 [Candidatus Thorarchaeota archaeon]